MANLQELTSSYEGWLTCQNLQVWYLIRKNFRKNVRYLIPKSDIEFVRSRDNQFRKGQHFLNLFSSLRTWFFFSDIICCPADEIDNFCYTAKQFYAVLTAFS